MKTSYNENQLIKNIRCSLSMKKIKKMGIFYFNLLNINFNYCRLIIPVFKVNLLPAAGGLLDQCVTSHPPRTSLRSLMFWHYQMRAWCVRCQSCKFTLWAVKGQSEVATESSARSVLGTRKSTIAEISVVSALHELLFRRQSEEIQRNEEKY